MIKTIPEEAHVGCYRLEWPDGSKSDDFYNWDRAHNHARRLSSTMARESSLEARGCV